MSKMRRSQPPAGLIPFPSVIEGIQYFADVNISGELTPLEGPKNPAACIWTQFDQAINSKKETEIEGQNKKKEQEETEYRLALQKLREDPEVQKQIAQSIPPGSSKIGIDFITSIVLERVHEQRQRQNEKSPEHAV